MKIKSIKARESIIFRYSCFLVSFSLDKNEKIYELAKILSGSDLPSDSFIENAKELKDELIKEGIKPHRCENCGLEKWMGQPIPLELHHIDGDRTNHKLSNLMMLCPNCHSQTETFRAKNIKM